MEASEHPLTVRGPGVCNVAFEHMQSGIFVRGPGWVLSTAEHGTSSPECAEDGGGEAGRENKKSWREEWK